jgi:hypothetical protein
MAQLIDVGLDLLHELQRGENTCALLGERAARAADPCRAQAGIDVFLLGLERRLLGGQICRRMLELRARGGCTGLCWPRMSSAALPNWKAR